MKNMRAIIWLSTAILLLLTGNLALDYWGKGDPMLTRRQRLFDTAERVTSVRIRHADGSSVTLVKSGRWRLIEPYAASADEQVVMKMLDILSSAEITDAVTDADLLKLGRTRTDFSLDVPKFVLSVGGVGWSETFSFGAITPSGDDVYVSIDGADAVFTVRSDVLADVDLSVDSLRRRSLFLIDDDDIASFDIKRGGGSLLSFVRNGDVWQVDGFRASVSRVRRFLSDIVSSSAVDFVWPIGSSNEMEKVSIPQLAAYGLDPESAVTVTLKCLDGVDRQISFGKDADDKFAFALAQNGGAVVTVPIALKEQALQDVVMFTDSRLFPYEASAVQSFTLIDGETSYALARTESGWRLDSPIAAPADGEIVKAILGKLLVLVSSDVVENGLKISISTNVAPVTVSSETLLGGLQLRDLRAREIMRIDPMVVKRIVSSSLKQDGSISQTAVVYGRDRNAWHVEAVGSADQDALVRESGVNAVLSSINPLVALRIERLAVPAAEMAQFGLENPRFTISIDQDREDSVRRNILIGKKTKGGRFATIGSSEAVFVLDNETVGKLVSQLVDER